MAGDWDRRLVVWVYYLNQTIRLLGTYFIIYVCMCMCVCMHIYI